MGLKTHPHWMMKYVDIHLFTLLSEDLNINWVAKGIKQDVRGSKRIQEQQRGLSEDSTIIKTIMNTDVNNL